VSRAPTASTERQLGDCCEWWPLGERRPCYAAAGFVLVRPSGETLTFSCAKHRKARASRIRGPCLVLERAEWEARGAGYRGAMLGG